MPQDEPSAAVARSQKPDRSDTSEPMTIDAVFVAPLLGLTPDAFMAAIKRGAVAQVTERGVGEDAGHYRVRFRYRRRTCRVIVAADTGAVVQTWPIASPHMEQKGG